MLTKRSRSVPHHSNFLVFLHTVPVVVALCDRKLRGAVPFHREGCQLRYCRFKHFLGSGRVVLAPRPSLDAAGEVERRQRVWSGPAGCAQSRIGQLSGNSDAFVEFLLIERGFVGLRLPLGGDPLCIQRVIRLRPTSDARPRGTDLGDLDLGNKGCAGYLSAR